MEANSLIDAAKAGDLSRVESQLKSGTPVDVTDEQGWTALSHAAGKGFVDLVKLLVNSGADVFKTGRDNRTPYLIALAAGRAEAAKFLRDVEQAIDPEKAKSIRPPRPYSKAYHVRDLRAFEAWPAIEASLSSGESGESIDDRIVFVHQDFTVTESMWHNEGVIFDKVTPEWRKFCEHTLGFKVPDDLDLIVSAQHVA